MSDPARKASLIPDQLTAVCPACGHENEVETQEDEAGFWRVPDAERYVVCDHCGVLMDAGWTGYAYAEGGGP